MESLRGMPEGQNKKPKIYTLDELNAVIPEMPFIQIMLPTPEVLTFCEQAHNIMHQQEQQLQDEYRNVSVLNAIDFIRGPIIYDTFSTHDKRRDAVKVMRGENLDMANFWQTNCLRINKLSLLKSITYHNSDIKEAAQKFTYFKEEYRNLPNQSNEQVSFIRDVKRIASIFVGEQIRLSQLPQTFF